MATERNTSSVLAKLMGIDRLLVPRKARGRRKILSENYLQNDFSVIHMEKAVLGGNTNVFIIDGDDSAECEELLKSAEKGSVDGHQSFNHSLPGNLAVQSPFCASQAENYKSIKTHLGQRRSCYNVDTGSFPGSTNKKQKTAAFGVNKKGLGLQGRRTGGLRHNNGMEYAGRENVSLKDIAKQITYQVNHSVWHNCIKDSRCVGSVDKRETENKCEMSASDTSKRSSRNTQKTKSELWSAKKYSEKLRTCHGRKTEHQIHVDGIPRKYYTPSCKDVNTCTLPNTKAYCSRVASARFLSKPTLFPSAWVPRSKDRCFTLNRNWCSRPEDRNTNLCSESSEDNIDINRSYTSDSAKLQEENTLNDTFSACRENGEVTLDEKIYMSSTLQGENLPVNLNKSIIFNDAASSRKDFVLENELKRKTSPPGSPVSSLEGPEACRRHLNFLVSSKEDVLGLPTKLHLIEAMSTESSSEGPGMILSSDASDGGGSSVYYREDAQIEEPSSESCNFSYLVDVLVESGMLMGNLEMESYVLDPLVFDLLENKYGKSDLRERSARRLLFDRIKSGLVEILQPCVGIHSWRKPVVKRLSGCRRSWAFVEEELWGFLVNQEQVKSDKACGLGVEWLDLEEDVVLIVEEIQKLLIDELVEELNMEMLFPW